MTISLSNNTRRIAYLRLLLLFVAVLCIGMACITCPAAWQMHKQHQHAKTHPLATFQGNMASPGTYTTGLVHSFGHSHGLAFTVESSQASPATIHSGLAQTTGLLIVHDTNGSEVFQTELSPYVSHATPPHVVAADVPMLLPGQYTATLRITSTSSRLANLPHTLHVRNRLCGLEAFIVTAMTGFAVICTALGFTSGLVTVPGLLEYGIWRAPEDPTITTSFNDDPVTTERDATRRL